MAASSIGCSIMNLQFRYLGVTVRDNMSRHKSWDKVVLKLRTRLSKWKSKTLSIGGSLTLLKSVLGASPLYNMSIFKAPKGVLKEMKSIRNKFFIGADSKENKITWVALNKRFVSQDGSLWSRVMKALYGPNINTHSVHMASNWCSILREVLTLKSKGFDFLSFCSKRVGDGSNTSFWTDNWKGNKPFCDVFPRLFALETEKQITVARKMSEPVASSFRRLVRGGVEQQQLTDLNSLTNSVSLSSSKDRWVCNISGDGSFSVKAIRNYLDDHFLPSASEPTRWVKSIPLKINVFAWRARCDCLPTRANLVHRGIAMESINCPMCNSFEEDVHHVFLGAMLRRLS
nr:hypothetical protein [Tanacetum cinerariifolium]